MLLLAASGPAQEPPKQETAKHAPPAVAEDNAAIFAFYGVPFHSEYLDVLRKQPDGSWKLVYRNGG
jgi:hypothetical protein